MGLPYLHHQPQDIRDYRLYRMSRHGHGIGFHRTNGTIRQVRLCELLVVPEPHPENRHGDGQGRGRTDHRHTTYFAGHGQIQQDVDHHGWRLRGQPIRLRGAVSLPYRCRDFHRRETVQVQVGRLAFGSPAQRYTGYALLDQQRYLADAGGSRPCSRPAFSGVSGHQILRPYGQSQQRGGICGRRY